MRARPHNRARGPRGEEMRPWELYVAALYWRCRRSPPLDTVTSCRRRCWSGSSRGVMVLGGFVFSFIITKVAITLSDDSAGPAWTSDSLCVGSSNRSNLRAHPATHRVLLHQSQARENPATAVPIFRRAFETRWCTLCTERRWFAPSTATSSWNEAIVEHVCQTMLPQVLTAIPLLPWRTPSSTTSSSSPRVGVRRGAGRTLGDGELTRKVPRFHKDGQDGPAATVRPGSAREPRTGVRVTTRNAVRDAVRQDGGGFRGRRRNSRRFSASSPDARQLPINLSINFDTRRAMQLAGLRALRRDL